MTESLQLLLACVAGGVLGLFFFGGLRFTVTRGVSMKQPALWFLSSLMLRMAVALAGFYFVTGGRWERTISCLLGFVVARTVMARWPISFIKRQPLAATGARHAP
jgi:F1F0 ATPase subunit 2